MGKELIHELPISIEKNKKLMINEFSDIISYDDYDEQMVIMGDRQQNLFIREFLFNANRFFMNDAIFDDVDDDGFSVHKNLAHRIFVYGKVFLPNILCANSIQNITREKIKIKSKLRKGTLQITGDMKPMKVITKFVDFIGKEKFPHYEEFRIAHSQILNLKTIKGTMCLSIHPIDFMTMSDNNNGWDTCMSWMNNGCYRTGTVEMMNSNNVICCYLKSKSSVLEVQSLRWSSKKMRVLAYITKDMIVTGKSYPYEDSTMLKAIVEELRRLAKENCNWTYSFGPELYHDMKPIRNEDYMRDYIKDNKKHRILFKCNEMYNDMFYDKDANYYCVRNKVKKSKLISYSGKMKCFDCGEHIFSEEGFLCYQCAHLYHQCDECKTILAGSKLTKTKEGQFCKRCVDS